jgi:hypothetical protein
VIGEPQHREERSQSHAGLPCLHTLLPEERSSGDVEIRRDGEHRCNMET